MTVAVVGAGIAGLTSAAALRRYAPDVEVEIYERFPELRLKGYSLGIKGESGIPVLRELGLFDGLRADAFLTTRFIFCDQRGRTLMRLPSREEGKNATYRIKRSSLLTSLRQAAADVPIHFNAECIGYDGAKLQFADGASATADWIVGADGVASVLRRIIIDDDRHYLGLSAIVGDSPASFDHPLLSGGNFLMMGDDGSSVFCYPQRDGTHLSYATHVGEDAVADGVGALNVLRGRVTAWAPPVPEIVAALDPATVVVRGYYDKEPPTAVHRGQLWLIGDAAHPMAPFLGQGANMAMVDGLRMGKTIADGGSADRLDDDIVRRARKAVLDSRKTAAMIHVTDRKKQSRRNRSWRFADFFINLFS